MHACCVPGTGVTVGTALSEMREKHPIILALMELMVYQETDNKQDKIIGMLEGDNCCGGEQRRGGNWVLESEGWRS